LLLLFLLIYALLKKKKDMADYLHVAGVMTACFLFWLCSAPLIRYGCVFLWLMPVLLWGYVYLRLSPHMDRYKLYLIALLMVGVYKLAAFGGEVAGSATADYLVFQKDYDNFETIPYEMHGYTFYYPAEGDRTGYEDFPAAPLKKEDIFRGDSLKEGFVSEERQ
jgi:hypothetical protein